MVDDREALKGTRVAGRPEEYFEPVPATGRPLRPEDYLEGLDQIFASEPPQFVATA